ncbi:threonine synthase [Lactococcus hodotermopsidis]|uniref:Threonine synthase n=1 Tax=Pseudolactococcus hodotermopsidis TaxID=2709157 RepID=A0A6A0BDP4_9LACT|nr:threonine synthase [Lactococcus hodotermopsidis]GFH43520.1 threonine synthase [Lactococcus hodotermopsidis]
MTLIYQSTRDKTNQTTASQAILQGLAVDGGLYVPTQTPKVTLDFETLKNATYQEVATLILSAFLDDFTSEEIAYCVAQAYDSKFDDPQIAPLVKLNGQYNLELFHGNTIAFKDMALSILPYLMTTAAQKHGVAREIVILTATSGDTGKAAMAGFANVPNTKIVVFYPKDGVSKIQERQMTTQIGENVKVIAIDGNFDHAQTTVKEMFNNENLRDKMFANNKQFSSANSMNIGRLVPQIAYYVYAYAQLVKSGEIANGEAINFTVPTGNFGNILAAYYAKQIGLPVAKLICASNENNVLTDFFRTGVYDKNREFFVTTSPSMDILVSSNLERLIFHLTGDNDTATAAFMASLNATGDYKITDEMLGKLSDFYADFANEAEISAQISATFKTDKYVEDPHTAVASAVYKKYIAQTADQTTTVVVSTASPYKFPKVVVESLATVTGEEDDFDLVKRLAEISSTPLPKAVSELFDAPVLHQTVVATEEMQKAVEAYLELK